MKFAHLADVHIGGWREEELKNLTIESFRKAIDICIKENVGFVLISGDLFNTSLPQIDLIKETASVLNKLRENDIDVYIIPGSHDFSPSGKTMLDVLEEAGLAKNVMKFKEGKLIFTIDKTGVKLTGIYGRRAGLESLEYDNLEKKHLEEEKGFKIFLFHTTLDEFKPEEFEKVQGQSYLSLPKNFNYYAGGHVHYLFDKKIEGYGKIVYPGPLFPNNFKELEELKCGRFCIVDDNLNLKRIEIKLKQVESFNIDVNELNANEAETKIIRELFDKDLKDKIVTLRVFGELSSGKISDINFKKMIDDLDCYIVLKNISKLTTKEFKDVEVKGESVEEIEEILINNVMDEVKEVKDADKVTLGLMKVLMEEKHEGEKVNDYEKRILTNSYKILENETK
ncbi:DNA repair exonuclease [Candidatus Woesearchaeota archaeon]|nr:DNA repair exonuclease [Candidatus Woesearchaeota archaeon]